MSTASVTPSAPSSSASEVAAGIQALVNAQLTIAALLQAQVKSLPGVTAINSYKSSLNVAINTFAVDMNIQGPNGLIDISAAISTDGFGDSTFGGTFGQ